MLGPKLDPSSKAPIVQCPGGNQSCRNRYRAIAKLISLKLSFSPSIPQPQISFLTAPIKKILFVLSPSAPPPHPRSQAAKKPVNWSLHFLTGSFQCLLSPQPRPSRLALQIMTLVFPPSFSSTQMYWPSRNCCSGLIPPLLNVLIFVPKTQG